MLFLQKKAFAKFFEAIASLQLNHFIAKIGLTGACGAVLYEKYGAGVEKYVIKHVFLFGGKKNEC